MLRQIHGASEFTDPMRMRLNSLAGQRFKGASMRHRFLAAAVLIGAVSPASAQDASFGCKVLLCAAATAPSWSGIPYCVPVMTQLFRQLARGRPWPTCPEGNAGGLGYDPYFDCPAGTVPASNSSTGDGGSQLVVGDTNGAYCATRNPNNSCNGDQGCSSEYILTDRPQRPDPNYVDITTGGTTTRFRFSLRGY